MLSVQEELPSIKNSDSSSQIAIPRSLRFQIGCALTIVAGVVDAIGYIELGGFFASFMSGASISLGVNVSVNEWSSVSQAGLLIAVFVIGATTSGMITGVMRPWGIPVALLLEASCLTAAVLMIARGWSSIDAIVPIVAAMGMQNTGTPSDQRRAVGCDIHDRYSRQPQSRLGPVFDRTGAVPRLAASLACLVLFRRRSCCRIGNAHDVWVHRNRNGRNRGLDAGGVDSSGRSYCRS